jgi:hypothetical protein
MSAPPSSHRLRNKVHSQLAALLDGGPLAAVPNAVQNYLDDRLIERVAHEYRAQRPDAPTSGYAAIITAGVPGAGKSITLNAISADYRRIDPDDIKDILLAQLETAGLLDIRHQHALADDESVSPAELSGWVHAASTDAADRVRAMSMRTGENFVMEGTLSWYKLPSSHVEELALNDYERLVVLDVEVPRIVAVEQSKRRWWDGRQTGRTRYGVRLGGRFISGSALDRFYSGPRTASTCATHARKLYGNANTAGIEAAVLIISRAANGAEYGALLTPDGDVQPWQQAPLGAVCIACGAILKNQQAILKGAGRSCAHRLP